MKISTNWIKDYVDIEDVKLKELADKMTISGINVESIEETPKIQGIVVGKVLTCEKIKDSDHLNICSVDIKDETLSIVCGAPNIRSGINVIVAKVGTILPGNFEIKNRRLLGYESNGMICGLDEIGLSSERKEIHVLPEDAIIGDNPYNYLNVGGPVFTLDLNPNRNDCLSHIGLAYEVASVLNKEVTKPEVHYKESEVDIKDSFELKVDTDKCDLFLLKLVKNIEIKESPDYIKHRLEEAGMRPINNIVDISNYVMLEYGQPLHFWDADKVGKTLGVRMANNNEEIITLDDKKRILNENDIVITNGESSIGIAGVMGGSYAEVTENTKNILIESAIFNPVNVRKTSFKLNLRTEASLRFEKGLNYEYTYEAVSRSCHLLELYADATIYKGMLVYDNIKKESKKISVSLEKINSVLGINLSVEDVQTSLDALGFEYTDEFDITIPNRRMDVNPIEEDIIEEVGRIYGYDKIKGENPIQEIKKGGYSPRVKYRKDISNKLRSIGLDEVRTYNLINETDAIEANYEDADVIKLDRPISKVKTHLRTSLVPSLIEVAKYNLARNVNSINIYEISNVYVKKEEEFKEIMKLGILVTGDFLGSYWNKTIIKSDFYLLKGIIENILHYLGFDGRIKFNKDNIVKFMHPGVTANILIDNEEVGFFGKIHPNISKEELFICEINLEKLLLKKSKKIKYNEPSKYPSIKRDMAFLFDKTIILEDVESEIKKVKTNILSKFEIFDVFEKEDKKSIAISFEFSDLDKTLIEDEVNEVLEKIKDNINKKFSAILRDK